MGTTRQSINYSTRLRNAERAAIEGGFPLILTFKLQSSRRTFGEATGRISQRAISLAGAASAVIPHPFRRRDRPTRSA
jgi:hypothetical protein